MAMIHDTQWVLQALRLSAVRYSSDPTTSRIITLDPSFPSNYYIAASGLADEERWPEIARATDSPPPEYIYSSDDSLPGPSRRRRHRDGSRRATMDEDDPRARDREREEPPKGAGGLRYTQTIMGSRSGGLGMRVSGRREDARYSYKGGRERAMSSSVAPIAPLTEAPPVTSAQGTDGSDVDAAVAQGDGAVPGLPRRPRAGSAPVTPHQLVMSPHDTVSDMLTSGHGMGAGAIDAGTSVLDDGGESGPLGGMSQAFVGTDDAVARARLWDDSNAGSLDPGESLPPGETGLTVDPSGPLDDVDGVLDEGSDVDEDELDEDTGNLGAPVDPDRQDPGHPTIPPQRTRPIFHTYRSSYHLHIPPLDFQPVPIASSSAERPSALTAALNKHIPGEVSTSKNTTATLVVRNPFANLYASVSAPTGAPSISLELFYPHSAMPSTPLQVKVRRDASVEEITGFGLFRFWEEGRQPLLADEEDEVRLSTVGWGLRIVEDDGEVDEDFPPLDRESKISKFSYGQFGVVVATEAQVKQNAAKAPHIVRRPSRVMHAPSQHPVPRPERRRSAVIPNPAAAGSRTSVTSSDGPPLSSVSNQVAGSHDGDGVLSAGQTVLLRVKVTASAEVHFTTTISVPQDMYIADLTEVLCKKKRLAPPYSDWVLCLAELTLALPLDRTVASLEGRTNLALVRKQWAMEHGLRTGDRRGGDPSASIFKRISEPAAVQRFGLGMGDPSQTYKKYVVHRKIAIGRHERVLAIDGDYIHIMPSESRAFFDSMKTTSFHITRVQSCKLTGRTSAAGFKINVWRDGGIKRYDFEAETGRQAAEIISTIRALSKSYQKDSAGRLPPSRTAAYVKR